MRLQKYLAECGVASRRAAEKLITQGRVAVNGQVVTVLGTCVEERDKVTLDGKPVQPEARKVYILLNKPKGYVTTAADTHNRPIVTELVDVPERVFPVGRLDIDTEGLLILTNDGEFANQLTHPKYGCEKTYYARLAAPIDKGAEERLRRGVEIDEEYVTQPAIVERKEPGVYRIKIKEGKKRQVRKMFEAVGGRVVYLRRTAIGGLRDTKLAKGSWRFLTQEEVRGLTAQKDVQHDKRK